ncbi:uncharacterized protein DS421_16g543400 [Arachis hypogaea]|nr:uncharacterized protein DS421_16g543400 [Arachis hypogaea]
MKERKNGLGENGKRGREEEIWGKKGDREGGDCVQLSAPRHCSVVVAPYHHRSRRAEERESDTFEEKRRERRPRCRRRRSVQPRAAVGIVRGGARPTARSCAAVCCRRRLGLLPPELPRRRARGRELTVGERPSAAVLWNRVSCAGAVGGLTAAREGSRLPLMELAGNCSGPPENSAVDPPELLAEPQPPEMPLPPPNSTADKAFKLSFPSVEFPGTSSSLRVVQIAAAAWG